MKIKKKTVLELMKTTRLRISMDTSEKKIKPHKGKGSYSRKTKHRKANQE